MMALQHQNFRSVQCSLAEKPTKKKVVNYSTPAATVEYAGAGLYRYIGDSLGSGEYLFAIRAEDSQGSENQSTARVNIEADRANPDSVSLLTVTSI